MAANAFLRLVSHCPVPLLTSQLSSLCGTGVVSTVQLTNQCSNQPPLCPSILLDTSAPCSLAPAHRHCRHPAWAGTSQARLLHPHRCSPHPTQAPTSRSRPPGPPTPTTSPFLSRLLASGMNHWEGGRKRKWGRRRAFSWFSKRVTMVAPHRTFRF